MAQEVIFSAPKHENMCKWRNGADWLEHWLQIRHFQRNCYEGVFGDNYVIMFSTSP